MRPPEADPAETGPPVATGDVVQLAIATTAESATAARAPTSATALAEIRDREAALHLVEPALALR